MGNELSTELAAIQDYMTETALEERVYKSPLLDLAQKPTIPSGKKDVAHFFRWGKLGYGEDVAEGADPATDETLTQTEIKVECTEISKAMKVIYYADKQRILKAAPETYKKFREQIVRSVNRRLTTALSAANSSGNNSYGAATFMYSNGKTAFNSITTDDYFRENDIQEAISRLIANGHQGPYHCVLNPWSRHALFTKDESFRDFSKQAGGKEMRTGTLGEWGGATIHLMHEPFRETLGGTEGTRNDSGEVVSTYVFAEGDAFGVSRYGGAGGGEGAFMPEFFVNPYISKSKAYFYISYRLPVGAVTLDPTKVIAIKSHYVEDLV